MKSDYEFRQTYMQSIRKDLLVFSNDLKKRKPWPEMYYWRLKAMESMLEPLLGYDSCD